MSEALTIPHLAVQAAARWPDGEAIVDGDRRISFAQLGSEMMDAAAAFVAAGLRVGDRVAIWAPNGADWIVACLGLQAAGGVLVPLNTRFKAAEAAYILRRAECAFVIAADNFLDARYADMVEALDLPTVQPHREP
ncbi:AMP-binding protein [Sphingomonas sp. MMS24-JH45]